MTTHMSPLAERVKTEVLHEDHRVKLWLLIVSVITLVVLLTAAVKENLLGEWRSHQRTFGNLLHERGTRRQFAHEHTHRPTIGHAVMHIQQ